MVQEIPKASQWNKFESNRQFKSSFLEYHNSLIEHGVPDYDWPKFSHDVEMALVETVLLTLKMCTEMKPKTFMKMMTTVSGDEKAENMLKVFEETGWMNKAILLLTGLYVKDKDNFLSARSSLAHASSNSTLQEGQEKTTLTEN